MSDAGGARHGVPVGRGEIRALTGLRGVAAAYVVLYHMLQDVPGDGVGATMIRHGYLAVDLFFVLSGFVLAMVHGGDRFDRDGYALFLRKRLARVYPLYAAVTLVTVILIARDGIALSPGRLAVNALLLQGWGIGASIVSPSWSLSAEIAAYLLFPVLATLVLRRSPAHALAGVGAAFVLLVLVASGRPQPRGGPLDLYQSNTVAPLIRCLCGFVFGLAAFRLRQGDLAQRRDRPGIGLGLGLLMLGSLAWRDADLLTVALMVPFVANLAGDTASSVAKVLASPPLHRLGILSFSIYLVHYPIRQWVRTPLAAALQQLRVPHAAAGATLLACAATLFVASLTYRLIERPARSMLRAHLRLAPTMP